MYKKTVSIFMILLIVTFPIYISQALANPLSFYERPGQKISRLQFYGEDEVNGVIRAQDTITVWAEVNEANINPSDLIFAGVQPFDNCTTSLGKSHCTYIELVSGQSGRNTFSVRYKDEDQATQFYYVDNTEPEVVTLLSETAQVGVENITFGYDVKDYYFGTDDESCSGIDRIEVYEAGTLVYTEEVDTKLCQDVGKISIDATGTAGQATNVSFCLTAYDGFGLISEDKCMTILVDNSLPVIGSVGAYVGTTKIDTFKTGLNTFNIKVNITDESGVKNNRIKISSDALSLVDEEAVCNSAGVCSLTSVTGLVAEDTTGFDLIIEAEDVNGNIATSGQLIPVVPDNSMPVINSLSSIPGGDYIGKGENVLVAQITEVGGGLYEGDVVADLSVIGDRLRGATNCTNVDSSWTCSWGNVKATQEGTRKISVKIKDRVGNVGATYEKLFTLDIVDPVVNSVNVTTADGLEFFQVGDTLLVTARIFDFTAGVDTVNTYINTSTYSTANIVNPTCEDFLNGTHECIFSIPQVTGPTVGVPIILEVYDKAGNKVTYTHTPTIDILGVVEQPSELWAVVVGNQVPAKIDKQTTSLLQQNAYVHLTVIPKEGAIGTGQILFVEVSNCGPQAATTYLSATTPRIVLESADKQNLTVKFPLAQTAIDVDNLTFNCALRVVTKYGEKATQPETVPFNVTLQFYNMPLGELSDNVNDEIQRVSKSGLVQAGWISTFNDIFTRAQQVCRLISTLMGILTAISTIGASLSLFSNLPPPLSGIYWSFAGGQKVTTITTYASIKVVRWTCAAITCTVVEEFLKEVGPLDKVLKGMPAIKSLAKQTGFESFPNPLKYFDPQKSVFGAILNFCIPGIFYNLQKARNIECQYVACLRDEVPTGTPIAICSNMRSFQWCTYVTGAWWELNPFNRIGSWFFEKVRAFTDNPVSTIAAIGGLGVVIACWALAKPELEQTCKIVQFSRGVSAALGVVSYFANIKQNFQMEEDLCEVYDIVGGEDEAGSSGTEQSESEI